jgi:hypothetical protein
LKIKNQTETEYIIQERTSLTGNPGDICNLNISIDLLDEIKKSSRTKILVEKRIYNQTLNNYIEISINYDKKSFLSLKKSAGKNKGKSYRLSLDSKELTQVKKLKSIHVNNVKTTSFNNLKEIKNNVQRRAVTGYKFEKEVCFVKGWKQDSKSPKFFWEGSGKSWVEKLKSLNFNVEAFRINLKKSKFDKWDATDGDDNYEIKKYDTRKLKGYILYSEPIIKIAPSRSKWKKGNPQYDVFPIPKKYNQFINDLMNSSWWKKDSERILNKIINSSKGIQFKDRFIEKNDIEFSWKLNTGKEGIAPIFEGYYRLSIVFRLKIN